MINHLHLLHDAAPGALFLKDLSSLGTSPKAAQFAFQIDPPSESKRVAKASSPQPPQMFAQPLLLH